MYLYKGNFRKESWRYQFDIDHRTCWTFLMARPKCLMRDFTNLNRIYKAHRTNVWWTMKVFRLHCIDNHIDELMQERHNSTVNALELSLSCTNPSTSFRENQESNQIFFFQFLVLIMFHTTHPLQIHDLSFSSPFPSTSWDLLESSKN